MITPIPAPWITPYLDDFAKIERALTRTRGFAILPVVLPSPDLARALAAWLGGEGHSVRTIEVGNADAWRDLAPTLEQLPEGPVERPVTVVIADGRSAEKAPPIAFARLNMARDHLARVAPHPILWCGDQRLIRATYRSAPNFASIAGVPYTIPLRQLSDLPEQLRHHAPWWWTGAASQSIVDLGDNVTSSADMSERTRSALRVAEAHLAGGDSDQAIDELVGLADLVDTAVPHLRTRWFMLHRSALAKDAPTTIPRIRGAIRSAVERGSEATEAELRFALADLHMISTPPQRQEAVDELLAARAIWLKLGDLEAAMRSSLVLTLDHLGMLSVELRQDLEDQAREVLDTTADPEMEAMAGLVLGNLAFAGQRFAEARSRCDHVLAVVEQNDLTSLSLVRDVALHISALVDLRDGHFESARGKASRRLALAERCDLPVSRLSALDVLSVAEIGCGQPREAAKHALEIVALAMDMEQLDVARYGVLLLAAAADAAGMEDVRRRLIANSARFLASDTNRAEHWLREQREHWQTHGASPNADDQKLLDIIERASLAEHTSEFDGILDEVDPITARLTRALKAQGIDPFDPDTWPEAPEPGASPDEPSSP